MQTKCHKVTVPCLRVNKIFHESIGFYKKKKKRNWIGKNLADKSAFLISAVYAANVAGFSYLHVIERG
jgi:hypothetical protein